MRQIFNLQNWLVFKLPLTPKSVQMHKKFKISLTNVLKNLRFKITKHKIFRLSNDATVSLKFIK